MFSLAIARSGVLNVFHARERCVGWSSGLLVKMRLFSIIQSYICSPLLFRSAYAQFGKWPLKSPVMSRLWLTSGKVCNCRSLVGSRSWSLWSLYLEERSWWQGTHWLPPISRPPQQGWCFGQGWIPPLCWSALSCRKSSNSLREKRWASVRWVFWIQMMPTPPFSGTPVAQVLSIKVPQRPTVWRLAEQLMFPDD